MLHLTGPAPWLLAWLAGTAVQLFQPALWTFAAYAWLAAGCGLSSTLYFWLAHRAPNAWACTPVVRQVCAALCVGGTLAFALTGVRALLYQSDSLNPALEGVDLQVTGVVSTATATATPRPWWCNAT